MSRKPPVRGPLGMAAERAARKRRGPLSSPLDPPPTPPPKPRPPKLPDLSWLADSAGAFQQPTRDTWKSRHHGQGPGPKGGWGADSASPGDRGTKLVVRFDPERKRRFLAYYLEFGTVSQAAQLVQVSVVAVKHARRNDKAFGEAFIEVEGMIADRLEAAAYRQAVEGIDEVQTHQGQEVLIPRRDENGEVIYGPPELNEDGQMVQRPIMVPLIRKVYSPRILEVLLKGNRPEKYDRPQRHQLEGHITGGVILIPQLAPIQRPKLVHQGVLSPGVGGDFEDLLRVKREALASGDNSALPATLTSIPEPEPEPEYVPQEFTDEGPVSLNSYLEAPEDLPGGEPSNSSDPPDPSEVDSSSSPPSASSNEGDSPSSPPPPSAPSLPPWMR